MAFLKAHQLNIMLFMSGICGVLALLALLTKSLSPRRKRILASIEAGAMFLLLCDRYAYLYRGDASRLGFWMVRVSNFLVFFFTLFIPGCITLYLIDLYSNEGGLSRLPRRLLVCRVLFAVGVVLLIVSQFTGLYYTFDEHNLYQRSPGYMISYLAPVAIMLLQQSVILQYRKLLSRNITISLLLNTFVPLAASILQIFVYGVSLINMSVNGMAIALYIFALVDLNDDLLKARRRERETYEENQKKQTELFEQTVEALVNAIEAKDKYTQGHSARVARYSTMIARESGKSEEECQLVYYAALLHDVGKIGISDDIINKVGKLTDEEYAQIKRHPVYGNNILSRIRQLPFLSIGAHFHHERYDGRGYPEGLKGEDIPEIARIIGVADAYDAMTSRRSYKKSIPQHLVREELVKGIGTQFDPKFAEAMIHLVDRDVGYEMQDQYEGIDAPIENAKADAREYRASSEGVLVTDKITRIQVSSRAEAGFSEAEGLPSLVLYDSLDGRAYENDESGKALMYFEYARIRLDGQYVCEGARKLETRIVDGEGAAGGDGNRHFDIETVRFKDHVKITIKDGKRTVECVVALPDAARFAYTTLAGEHCSMSPIHIAQDADSISEDYIPRIAEEVSYIKGCPEGDVPNLQIDYWRSETSEGIPVADGVRISFHTQSLPTARLIWHCPYVSVFTAKDGRTGGEGYREFMLLRLDGENWESDEHAHNEVRVDHTMAFVGWNAWKEKHREGLDCELEIRREGNLISIRTDILGVAIYSRTRIMDPVDEVYVALTGDQCALTNIRVYKA